MATLEVKKVILAGLKMDRDVDYVEPATQPGGDIFENSGRVFVHVVNLSGVTIAVQINTQTPCNQGVDDEADIADILAGEERMIGPFRKDRFNNTSGMCNVICTPHGSVKIAAIEVP